MVEDSPRGSNGLLPALVLLIATALLLVLLLPRSTPEPRAFFIEPDDGDSVPTTFTVRMGATGLRVVPAGEPKEGEGHFHILVDSDFIPAGQAIPNDEQHLHFGKGVSEAEITLPPGEHTLRLQFADGVHTALEGEQYQDEIQISVMSDE
jgi:hypothetical protein